MKKIAASNRLIIREYDQRELAIWLALGNDEDVTLYTPKRSDEENRLVFQENLEKYKNGTGLGRWAIIDADSNDFIGNCMLVPARPGLTGIELGYALYKKYWGKNLGTEVAALLIDYGFNNLHLQRICAITHPKNIASQKVLLKVGFKQFGTVFLFNEYMPYFEIENNIEEGL